MLFVKLLVICCIDISLITIFVGAKVDATLQGFNDNSTTTKTLLNVNNLLVEIGEDVQLDCIDNKKKFNDRFLTFEWYRKEEHWFFEDLPVEKLVYNNRKLLISENKIVTVLYKCIVKSLTGDVLDVNSFRLYVDRAPRKVRELTRKLCFPPRCKPYASVVQAHCNTVELNITYPRYQHGYNRSTNTWGNVLCNDEIGGFQVWVVGQGILKRFLPYDLIVIDNLKPGRTYCFNGWAYNSCGAGPVFTLEGVCAVNDVSCQEVSHEHCYQPSEDFY